MRKQDLLNLIRAHVENNDDTFRRIANGFAVEFMENGEEELGRQIAAYLSDALSFMPQSSPISSSFFVRVDKSELDSAQVYWPSLLFEDVKGVCNAIRKRSGVSKFLFYGAPGTGKTETAKIIASLCKCDLWVIDFPSLVDYRLGETSKNIADMFQQISSSKGLKNTIFLFDEVDAIAMDRVNANDLREMGRATTAFLKGMETLPKEACIIATTNLRSSMDKALLRRFDAELDFDSYSKEDLIRVGVSIYGSLLADYPNLLRDERLFEKIIRLSDPPLCPGDLKNALRSAIAFGGDEEPSRYLTLLLRKIAPEYAENINELAKKSFTTRQISTLLGLSKSAVSRRTTKNG